MDDFEKNLDTFTTTIYGQEMRKSLGYCFNFLYENTKKYADMIAEANLKITEMEKKGGD